MHLNPSHALLLVTLLAGQGCSSSSDRDFEPQDGNTGGNGIGQGAAGSDGNDGSGGSDDGSGGSDGSAGDSGSGGSDGSAGDSGSGGSDGSGGSGPECLGADDALSSVCEGISSCSEGGTYAEQHAPTICSATRTKLKSEVSNAIGQCFIDVMAAEQCASSDLEGCIADGLLDACEDEAAATLCEALEDHAGCGPLDIQTCGAYLSGMSPAFRSTVLSCVTEGAGCAVYACVMSHL